MPTNLRRLFRRNSRTLSLIVLLSLSLCPAIAARRIRVTAHDEIIKTLGQPYGWKAGTPLNGHPLKCCNALSGDYDENEPGKFTNGNFILELSEIEIPVFEKSGMYWRTQTYEAWHFTMTDTKNVCSMSLYDWKFDTHKNFSCHDKYEELKKLYSFYKDDTIPHVGKAFLTSFKDATRADREITDNFVQPANELIKSLDALVRGGDLSQEDMYNEPGWHHVMGILPDHDFSKTGDYNHLHGYHIRFELVGSDSELSKGSDKDQFAKTCSAIEKAQEAARAESVIIYEEF